MDRFERCVGSFALSNCFSAQIVTFNGSQEHIEMSRRGIKIERVYECKDCDKAFTREEHLKRHAKSHTDEPVHRCEVLGCQKAYTRKERLTRHYKVSRRHSNPLLSLL